MIGSCVLRTITNISSINIAGVRCPMLYAPIYGSVEINETQYESTVRYYCDHGYKLLGNAYRTCDYSGQWTNDAPSCIRK